MPHPRTLVLLGAAALLALGSAYFAGGSVPRLVMPVSIEEAVFIPDGGSFHLGLRDASGSRFAFGASGALDREPEDHGLYIQRWGSSFPLPYFVQSGSDLECALVKAAASWTVNTAGSVPSASESLEAARVKLNKKCSRNQTRMAGTR